MNSSGTPERGPAAAVLLLRGSLGYCSVFSDVISDYVRLSFCVYLYENQVPLRFLIHL